MPIYEYKLGVYVKAADQKAAAERLVNVILDLNKIDALNHISVDVEHVPDLALPDELKGT